MGLDSWSLDGGSIYDAALMANADTEYGVARTADSVSMSYMDSSTPVTADTGSAGGWESFWRGTLGAVVNYGMQRDMMTTQAGIQRENATAMYSASQGQAAAQGQVVSRQGLQITPTMLITGVLVWFIATRAGK